jgi:hypothetical protein
MPTVAKLNGMSIVFYHNEHPPPHFHVKSGEHHAIIEIATLEIIEGFLPFAKRRVLQDWAASRRDKLLDAFAKATSHKRVGPIE